MPRVNLKRIILSLVITLAIWAVFSWPLPMHFSRGIPDGAHPEPAEFVVMIAGDHMQFEYYCWLAADMITGRTRPMYNVYEFNTGEDSMRFQPEPYYFPFPVIYLIGSAIGGRAFGWNIMGFVALWLSFLLAWLLARRYAERDWIAAIAAIAAIALPFRWINLFGGSPAGLAMLWIPMLWLGIDVAVRDNNWRGGLVAGIAILFACFTDSHVLGFGIMSIPAWCIVAFAARTDGDWRRSDDNVRLMRALVPLVVLTLVAMSIPPLQRMIYKAVVGSSALATIVKERTWVDVMNNSPMVIGLFAWKNLAQSSQIYIGYTIPLLIIAGGAVFIRNAIRRWQLQSVKWPVLILLLLGLAIVISLALGANGPIDGALTKVFRKLVPPYAFVRQTAKAFVLIGPLLAVTLAVTLTALAVSIRRDSVRAWTFVVIVVAMLAEYSLRANPTISILDKAQKAYAAVAADARQQKKDPRALVLPIWPGDSHQTSIYEYYASLYRIRMVNGYTPFVAKTYREKVFPRFEPVNQGVLTEKELGALREARLDYLVLHENRFEEKVSPYPVAATLRRLLENPNLEFMAMQDGVWSFKLLDEPRPKAMMLDRWNVVGCAGSWDAERPACPKEGGEAVVDPEAAGGGYLALKETNTWVGTTLIKAAREPDMRWIVRIRGRGGLDARIALDGETNVAQCAVDLPDWKWQEFPFKPARDFSVVNFTMVLTNGAVDIDRIQLVAGAWKSPQPGGEIVVPAPCFFHAGFINLERESVVFHKDRDDSRIVLYGPKLPLEKGIYEVEFYARSGAPAGTLLGRIRLRNRDAGEPAWTDVIAGMPAVLRHEQGQNVPVSLEFFYVKNADIEIDRVAFRRKE